MWCIRHFYERRSFSQHQAKIWTFKLSPIRKNSLCKKEKRTRANTTDEIAIALNQLVFINPRGTKWNREKKNMKTNSITHQKQLTSITASSNMLMFLSTPVFTAELRASNTHTHIPFPSMLDLAHTIWLSREFHSNFIVMLSNDFQQSHEVCFGRHK